MRYPETFIEDLKRQADIVRVIQDYVPLKKKGVNWMACCPFHQEKTPSFTVSAKGFFYCFGCSAKGNVFNFVMQYENVTFPEAIKIVAEKTGVPLPVMIEDRKFEERKQESDEIFELNLHALEWWEAQLEEGGPERAAAREYIEGRGITDETRKAFRLGFAPDRWDALLSFLKQKGATEAQIERSGLVSKNEAGKIYDRFRGRIIFPVFDVQGRAVAFGARILGAGEPKYLNSPETPVYTKGKHLYGLYQNREGIRQRKFVILVEGYLDLIIPYQFGVRNAVASLGTALTPEQAKLLGRFARKTVVNYDGDSAGVKAAKRAIETLLAEDFEIKVLVLPGGADPDEFIRANGVSGYNELRGKAQPHLQFILDQAVRQRNLLRPADKAAAVEEVLPYIFAVRNSIQRREYFDIAMNFLRVEDASLKNELWRSVKTGVKAEIINAKQRVTARIAGAKPTLAERQLLELLAHDGELRKIILPRLEIADYEALASAAIFRALIEIEETGEEITAETLLARTEDDPFANDFSGEILMSEPQRAEGEAIDDSLLKAERCLVALRLMALDRATTELGVEIANAEREEDTERLEKLILERSELIRKKNALSSLKF
jgi:DNA primase